MLPRIEMLKIARAHIESGAKYVYNERGIPAFCHEGQKCLIGLFIPASTYHCEDIESMNIYEMRDAGILNNEELEFLKEIDRVNVLDDDEWLGEIQEKIDDELETSSE